jgi:iron complex outermembrane recepter protein
MRKFSLLMSVALGGLASPVWAQQTAPQTEPQAEEATPEAGEIIVTATRRAELLSDVPIAVSAVSGEALANTGATDVRALNQLAPSLLVSGATSEVNFSARVRGVGTVGENAGLESSVALFIDGVYRSRTGVGLSELGDIERVEVLRGPQGTLFGRNASAGLINIITKGPSYDFGGSFAATYGNYDYLRFDAAITGPIIADKVAFRLDGVSQQRDGFIRNTTPGAQDINDRQRYLVRGQLLIEPNDSLKLRLIGDYSKRNEICCGAVNYGPNQNVTRNATTGELIIGANTLLPVLQALGSNIQVSTPPSRFVRSQSTTPGFNYVSNSEDYGISSEGTWSLGDVTLTGISSYRDYKNRQGQDSDYSALDILRRTALDRRFRTFTQEFRAQGEAFDKRLDWIVGGYFANEILNVRDDLKFGNDYERFANCVLAEGNSRAFGNPALLSVTGPGCFNQAVAGPLGTALAGSATPATAAAGRTLLLLSGLVPGNPAGGFDSVAAAIGQPALQLNGTGVVDNRFRQKSVNYAFFTHNVIDIVRDKLSLTLGGRYTNEKKTLTGSFNTNNNLCGALRASPLAGLANLPCVINNTSGAGIALGDPNRKKKESEFTGTAVLSYKPSKDFLVYGSYSRGYKAGGFNLDTSAFDLPNAALAGTTPINTVGNGRPDAADLQFAPEIVNAYEIGAKYNGRKFNLNAAVFYSEFDNFQLNTFNGVNFEVTNVNSCRDDLAGADRDILPNNAAAALTGACAPGRLGPGLVTKGLELEASIFPARFVSINLGFTYAKTEYQDDLVGFRGRAFAPTSFQLPEQQLSNAPEYVVTGGLAYSPDIGSSGLSGLAYIDFRYQSDVNTGSDLDPEKVQDGYVVFNGRLGLYGKDKRWGVEIFGQNLLNKKYQQIAADAPLQGGSTIGAVRRGGPTSNQLFIAFPGEPRTYGVTLKGKF